MNNLKTPKGSALIISFFVLSFLVTLSAVIAMSTFSDLSHARRMRESTKAFWLAESGLSLYKADPSMLDRQSEKSFDFAGGKIFLRKDESTPGMRFIRSTGVAGEYRRVIEISYPALAPEVFNTAISSKGDITITGSKSSVIFNDKVILSGNVQNTARHSIVLFEDKREFQSTDLTSLRYSDVNQSGIADEFSDFLETNRRTLASYPKSEVIYLQGNDTFTIVPSAELAGKKIIYVEGDQNKGNVNIQFNGDWGDGQNLTVISTGKVHLNHGGQGRTDSQLNVIAWGDYIESAVLPGVHNGMIFTHGQAVYDDIYDTTVSNGVIVANNGIRIGDVWSTKVFNYRDPRRNGALPPGFEGLKGKGFQGFEKEANGWREM